MRRSGKRKVKEKGTKSEQGKYSGKYALTELIYCGECGTPYRRCTWSKNGKKKVVWRCISRLDYGKKYCTESPSLEEHILQDTILKAVMKMAGTLPSIMDILKQHIGMGLSETENHMEDLDIYAMQVRVSEIDRELDELYELLGKDNSGDFEDRFEMLYAEQNTLKEKLVQIRADKNHASAEQSRTEDVLAAVDKLPDYPVTWDEQFIRQMVECIRVKSKDEIAIRFRLGVEMDVSLTK